MDDVVWHLGHLEEILTALTAKVGASTNNNRRSA
jgi:hypothetical protein